MDELLLSTQGFAFKGQYYIIIIIIIIPDCDKNKTQRIEHYFSSTDGLSRNYYKKSTANSAHRTQRD